MSRQTLLLNADCNLLSINPLSTVDWQSAVKMEYTEAVDVLERYNWTVHSPSCEYNVPAVLMLKEYTKISRNVKFSLRNLYLRDDYTCQYCNKQFEEKDLSKDHVTPRKYGGKTNWTNIVTACRPCNHRRGHNQSIRPISEPRRPTIWEIEAKLCNRPVIVHHESWLPYLEGRWADKSLLIKAWD